MKKLKAIIAVVFLAVSCIQPTEEETKKQHSRVIQNYVEIVELSFNGTTHEFVVSWIGYRTGLTHWPDCKYCKENNNE